MSKFANMYETDPSTSEILNKNITRMKSLVRMIYWFKSVSGLSKHKLRFSGRKEKKGRTHSNPGHRIMGAKQNTADTCAC